MDAYMADLSYSVLPVAGTTNNASDVVTPLNEIKSYVNALNADANNAVYKTIVTGSANIATFPVGTYWLSPVTAGTSGSGTTSITPPWVWRFTASDYSVTGKTTQFRLKSTITVGGGAPSTTVITAGVHPVTVVAGNWTLAAAVAGTTAASSGLATNTISPFSSGDFAASALTSPGNYVVGFTVATLTVPVGINISWELQVRHT